MAAAEPPRQAELVHRSDVAGGARWARAADNPDLRALVVIGNGRAFSSGMDTSVFTGSSTDSIEGGDDAGTRHPDPTVDGILRTQEAYSWLEEARYPTIAAVRGYARRRACRWRWRATSACPRGASVGLLEHKYGILPDLGGTQRLPPRRRCGQGQGADLGPRARIDADEAYRIGLCERLVDDDTLEADAGALAAVIAATTARGAGREARGRGGRSCPGRRRARRRSRGPAVGLGPGTWGWNSARITRPRAARWPCAPA